MENIGTPESDTLAREEVLIDVNPNQAEIDRIEAEKSAEKSALSDITRRKVVYIFVTLLAIFAIVSAIILGIFSSQLQNTVSQGATPPISSNIINANTTDPNLIPIIPQGGMLISRPWYYYIFSFITDLVLTATGTSNGMVIWKAGIQGLETNSGALLSLTNRGVLNVTNASGTQILWTNAGDYPTENPEGSYTLQVVETGSSETSPGNGELQILNPSGAVIWFRNATTPSGS